MPPVRNNQLQPNLFFRNRHFNTLYRYLTNNTSLDYKRERMFTTDADFIDLDIASVQSNKAIITIHGLEGSSNSSYIRSLSQMANQHKYDVIAINLRGCSGEPNLTLGSYHSGKTDDLLEVIQYIEAKNSYKEIHLVGFSLGGNITLKLMGEFATTLPKILKTAVAVSVPCDLKGSAEKIDQFSNKLYQYNFLKTLREKAKHKIKRFPNANVSATKVLNATNFNEFDEYFTAAAHGFKDADDYYKKSSSKQFIKDITRPSLLISALDDPFLSESCYPFVEATHHKHFHLLTPRHGGHVGFYSHFIKNKNHWLEKQVLNFIENRMAH
ncbi:MAG: alpha/beta fold hydrolase [Bacteroidales bacterium]|nr:alpha/beta fold hydrolase [Bacteroidales bacterium]